MSEKLNTDKQIKEIPMCLTKERILARAENLPDVLATLTTSLLWQAW
jgi:hypothetical protein